MIGRHQRRTVLAMLSGTALALPWMARSQETAAKRIAVLSNRSGPNGQADISGLEDELRKLGWAPGRDLVIDGRFAEGVNSLYAKFAAELLTRKPDVIFANTTAALTAIRPHAGRIPIVFSQVTDPVGQGIVPNLTHPGGTITGFAGLDFTASGRWLQLLKELVPDLARVLVLYTPNVSPPQWVDAALAAAAPLGLTVIPGAISSSADVETVPATFALGAKGALAAMPSSFIAGHRKELIATAAKYRLPAIYPQPQFVHDGGLMCGGGFDFKSSLHDVAAYVDRILRGEKPGDLPVQYPTRLTVLINLKTARALGITIPPSLLARADEVIE